MSNQKQQVYNEWLVIRCQTGDRCALNILLKNWSNKYLLYARFRLKDKEAAKDATQECLITISKQISSLADPKAFPKWSYTILERRCIDWLRKTVKEREILQTTTVMPEAAREEPTDQAITVGQLLERLNPDLAGILRLHYLEGFTLQEIAGITGLPLGTLKSRLFYTRKLLAQLLENNYEQH